MNRILIVFLLCTGSLFAEMLPRRVIGFWDSRIDKEVESSLIHTTLEMPLNYLGIDVTYSDIQDPLPSFEHSDICGIIVCFQMGTQTPNPKEFINWLIQAIDRDKKVVLMCNRGFQANEEGIFTSGEIIDRLYDKLGLVANQKWVERTTDYKILSEKNELTPFEGELPQQLPAFYHTDIDDTFAKSYLRVGIPDQPDSYSDLIVLSPSGAYISEFYANNYDPLLYVLSPHQLLWYINPFKLFEIVFNRSGKPIPDATTLAGKRIFFSTCHGDAWRMDTEIERYKSANMSCAEVVLEAIIKPNPDIPVSMGVVAAEIDPSWVGTKKSQEVAREYFKLPQVGAASHSYSHPFAWSFFKEGQPEKEIDFLHLYPYGSWQNSMVTWSRAKFYQYFKPKEYAKQQLKWGYVIPRAFANKPFDLNLEIEGSIDYINKFTSQDRPADLYLWSGDGLPWDIPVELCYKAKIQNQSGGFVRFDKNYPSNLFVFPLARKPGGYIQLYNTSNGENDYTNGWKDQFYGFQNLPATLENTESPRRLKPILLFYHSYSGQFDASLKAVLKNIEFIKNQKPIAITANRYCEIGLGFFEAAFEEMGENKWKVLNRGGLQTIRFDTRNLKVDLSDSTGIIGFREHQGSLYVYLDKSVAEPIISLKQEASASTPFLIESSWEIWDLKRENDHLSFLAKGWGELTMAWNLLRDGVYILKAAEHQTKFHTDNQIFQGKLNLPFNTEIHIEIVLQQ